MEFWAVVNQVMCCWCRSLARIAALALISAPIASAQDAENIVLGRPTDESVAISVLAVEGVSVFAEYGTQPSVFNGKTAASVAAHREPIVLEIGDLQENTRYFYRLRYRQPGDAQDRSGEMHSFHTQRPRGSTFSFGVQGDSHPERLGIMYHPDLYRRTLELVADAQPDLYFMLGDDFSTQRLIESWREGNKEDLSQSTVNEIYLGQRDFLTTVANATALFHVNGNHEEAKLHLIGGPLNDAAIFAGRARTEFFPLPAPDDFYGGNPVALDKVGLLRDYYSFIWGDALFITIDPYWHSPVPVGNVAGDRYEERDLWDVTMGDEQYAWLKKTLESSDAKYKFVFTHHVLGVGRGGIEAARDFEWGGYGPNGEWEFDQRRPNWELPVHQLMVKHGVTIFFQAHDHLFAQQELDGVIYQSVPNPADDLYKIYNRNAYTIGDVLPNSGYLNVTVAPQKVTVDYVRSFLPKDEVNGHRHGETAFSYSVE